MADPVSPSPPAITELAEDSSSLPHPLPQMFTVLLLVVFVVGVAGNVLTSVTILRTRFLRSTTNLFLCNLAVSDTLLLIFGGAPFDIMLLWNDNRSPTAAAAGFCEIRVLLAETGSSASVGTIMIVTIERYLAICQPFNARPYYQNRRRLWIGILIVWIVSLCPSIVIAYQYKYATDNASISTESGDQTGGYGYCDLVQAFPYIYEITFVTFFIFPMLMIAMAYALIVRQIRMSLSRQPSGSSQTSAEEEPSPLVSKSPHVRARYMVIRMLIVVVTVFFFTHLPMHIQRLLYLHTPQDLINEPETIQFLLIWYNVAGVLQFSGAASNPFMYTAMSRRFRLAFQRFMTFGYFPAPISTGAGAGTGSRTRARTANHMLKPLNTVVEAGVGRRKAFSRSALAF